jgi:hypothetical protein
MELISKGLPFHEHDNQIKRMNILIKSTPKQNDSDLGFSKVSKE